MEKSILELLGFDTIKESLKQYSVSACGADLIESQEPETHFEKWQEQQKIFNDPLYVELITDIYEEDAVTARAVDNSGTQTGEFVGAIGNVVKLSRLRDQDAFEELKIKNLEMADQLEKGLKESFAGDEMADEVGESKNQIYRYIRLTYLIPQILYLVDEGKIGLRPAVELSYLTKHEQEMLVEAMALADCTPTHAQAIRLRAFSKDGTLGRHVMENVMNEEKPNQKDHIRLRYDDARRFIPSSVPYNKTGEYIMKALEYYHKHLERQRQDRDTR